MDWIELPDARLGNSSNRQTEPYDCWNSAPVLACILVCWNWRLVNRIDLAAWD